MLSKDNIRRIVCGAYRENAYLACPDGRDDAFLVDPGDDVQLLQNALRESGRTLSAILLTHGHFDHILAAQPLSERFGAPVYIHEGDAEMLDAPDLSGWNAQVCRLAPPEELPRTAYGETLRVAGVDLQVLSTPGHSRGSVCLYEPLGGILFSGDTLFEAGYGRTDLHGGSDDDMVASLRRLLTTLPEQTLVLSGHGGATTIGRERRRYRL